MGFVSFFEFVEWDLRILLNEECITVESLYNVIEGPENFSRYIEVKFEDFCVAGTENFSRYIEVHVIIEARYREVRLYVKIR
jgi:hypothetical protein